MTEEEQPQFRRLASFVGKMARPYTFACSICEEESTQICVSCTKDACANHLCAKCSRCSDCCTCEVALEAVPVPEPPLVYKAQQPQDEEIEDDEDDELDESGEEKDPQVPV